jgi:uncharacterized membrane protein YkoI
MQKLLGRLAAGVVMMVLTAAGARADEEKVPLDKLPKAVTDAVKAKFPSAELVKAEKETEDGKTVYEVNLKSGGHSMDVTVTPEGKILEVEKTIAAKDLPKAVANALEAKYPRATITIAEEISKDDKIVAYEMVIVTADKKKLEVVFDPQGTFKKEEKKGDKEKD